MDNSEAILTVSNFPYRTKIRMILEMYSMWHEWRGCVSEWLTIVWVAKLETLFSSVTKLLEETRHTHGPCTGPAALWKVFSRFGSDKAYKLASSAISNFSVAICIANLAFQSHFTSPQLKTIYRKQKPTESGPLNPKLYTLCITRGSSSRPAIV